MDRAESIELLSRAREGSEGAIGTLFERCAGRLLGLIRLRLGPELRRHLESRDILQGTFLKAFDRIEQFRGDDGTSLMGWLARISENEIRDRREHFGRQRRDADQELGLEALEKNAGEGLAAPLRSALSEVLISEEQRRLEAALESLSEEHREVLLLRKFEELPFAEVGRRMGRSADACRMLLARAMTALTLAMEDGESSDAG